MKKSEVETRVRGLDTVSLAALAGVSLNRGRPSFALRDDLAQAVLIAISEKRVKVGGDGTLTRGDVVVPV